MQPSLCRCCAGPCRDVDWPALAASRVVGPWPKDVLSRWAPVSTAQRVGRAAGSPGWAWKPPDDARDLGPVQSHLYLHAGSLFWESSPCSAIQGFSPAMVGEARPHDRRAEPVRALWKEQPRAPPAPLSLCRYSASPCRDVDWPALAASRGLGPWPKDAAFSVGTCLDGTTGWPGCWLTGLGLEAPDDVVFFLDGGL